MTEQEFRQAARSEGFSDPVAVERDAGYTLGLHTHAFEAYALILDGEIALTVDGASATYRTGQTFRLVAGTPHLEAAGPAGVRYLSTRKEPA